MAKLKFMDQIMAEHIRLPGCPQIVCTRGFAHQHLIDCGFDPKTGWQSLDRMVFGAREISEPLTEMTSAVAAFLANIVAFETAYPERHEVTV